jgi:hypothetical protein
MSHDNAPRKKAEALERMDASWARLTQYVNALDEQQLTERRDAVGWTAKDHLAHLTAWERSMVYLLQGKPRHEGLGVEESTYLDCGFDEINAAIREATRDLPLDDVLGELRSTHEQLRALVSSMSEEDLQQPYAYFLPNEPGRDDGQPILARISGNADGHFDEHLPYIEKIVTGG